MKGTSQPILVPSCHSSPVPPWAPQARLRVMLEVTQQQATQAKSQLQELQQQSSQIQVQACLSHPTMSSCCVLQAATRWSLRHWAVDMSYLENAPQHYGVRG